MGTVTASTSSILFVMREDLEDKQVAPSVVYVESGISIGTRTGGGLWVRPLQERSRDMDLSQGG